MKVCVVNVSNGSWYPLGQKRLAKTLQQHGYKGEFLFWTNKYPAGCPTHQQVPYAFKTWALREARAQGFDIALWLDSSMKTIRPLDFIMEEINKNGYWLPVEQQNVGSWTTDAGLGKLNLTRDEGKNINCIMCGCIGLDFRNVHANDFLDQWHSYATDGVSFLGPHGKDSRASTDPYFSGHRHDLPSASVIAHREQLKVFRWAGEIVPEYGEGQILPQSIFLCKRSCDVRET